MDRMEKLKKIKKGHLSPNEQNAKMSVLEDLKKQAEDAMGGKLSGLKKVSVMSDSQEGLQHGLQKAQELMHGQPEAHAEGGFVGGDGSGKEDEEESEEHMSPEEIDAKIQHLMELKKQKMHS